MKSGDKVRLVWQGDSEASYELIDIHLGYAQLLNTKINTIKWANAEHLIKSEV